MNEELSANLPAELEQLDSATDSHIAMPPALVQGAQEDPELLVQLTRGQLAVIQDRMVRRVLGDPEATVGALATVHKALSENAQLKPGQGVRGAAGDGVGVVINFIIGSEKKSLTIEGQAQPVDVLPA